MLRWTKCLVILLPRRGYAIFSNLASKSNILPCDDVDNSLFLVSLLVADIRNWKKSGIILINHAFDNIWHKVRQYLIFAALANRFIVHIKLWVWFLVDNGTISSSIYGHFNFLQLWASFVTRTKVWKNRLVGQFPTAKFKIFADD